MTDRLKCSRVLRCQDTGYGILTQFLTQDLFEEHQNIQFMFNFIQFSNKFCKMRKIELKGKVGARKVS